MWGSLNGGSKLYMTKSNNTTTTALPKFWVRALQALRELTLNQGSPGQCATQEEAKAMPVFYNPLFEIRNRKHMDSWTELLQLRTIGDMINESDTSGDLQHVQHAGLHRRSL